MMTPGTVEFDVAPGWEQSNADCSTLHEQGSWTVKNASYTRGGAVSDTSLEMKVKFAEVNKLKCLCIISNARFVEIYAMKGSLLKYMATMRGVAPEVDHPPTDFPLFECKYTNEACEFRELHFKFLSIKPPFVPDSGSPLQLSLVNLTCEYSAGQADTAPPLQQGPSLGGMSGAGGVDMMAMMAMSMMGGMSGVKGMGTLPGPSPNTARPNPVRAPTVPLMPVNRQEMGEDQRRETQSNESTTAVDLPNSTDNATASNVSSTLPPNPSAVNSADPKQTLNRATSNSTSAAATNSANPNGSTSSRPAATAPGLDIAQLASMLWTVKGSMLDEMSQLLDRKLAPVMSRLDRIDGKLRDLEAGVSILQRNDGEQNCENCEENTQEPALLGPIS